MMKEKTSIASYEEHRLFIINKMAVEDPAYQPEIIARHYTKLAIIALELLRLCEARQHGTISCGIDELIDYLSRHIRRAHLEDFAIPLVWDAERTSPEI
jgi:hypothetical protein